MYSQPECYKSASAAPELTYRPLKKLIYLFGLPLASEHDAAILRLPDETKAALPFVQLAFARAEVALDAAVIEAMPPLRAHDTRLDHLAMEYGHTIPYLRIQLV